MYGYGNLTITDTASGDGNPTATVTITAPSLGTINQGFIGDSITAGTNGNPTGDFQVYLNGLGYSCTVTNEGVSSTTTTSWLPGGSLLNSSVSAFISAGATDVHIMLGTNDAKVTSVTASTYAANMAQITGYIVSQGLTCTISRMPWTLVNADAGTWPYNTTAVYQGYWAAIQPLFNGRTVFLGDTGISEYSTANPQTFLETAGIHPANNAQNELLGQFWAQARIERLSSAPPGGAFIGGGLGMIQPITGLAATRILLAKNPMTWRRRLIGLGR
jgi:hypothetical protein